MSQIPLENIVNLILDNQLNIYVSTFNAIYIIEQPYYEFPKILNETEILEEDEIIIGMSTDKSKDFLYYFDSKSAHRICLNSINCSSISSIVYSNEISENKLTNSDECLSGFGINCSCIVMQTIENSK